MHAKYEVYVSYSSKVIANVKVDKRQTDRQRQTRQKQYVPDCSIQGHKKEMLEKLKNLSQNGKMFH